jgi:hypothetical protein
MKAHFFDLDVLIKIDNLVWIVSKTKPKSPIIKLTQSEFNLIKNGIYKRHNSKLKISGSDYWLPENLLNEIKIKCKMNNVDLTELAFSMQEFMNPELIDSLPYDILTKNFEHLKNSNDDIYVICSKNSKKNYETIIKKLEKSFFELGLKVKDYYYLSETFYNRDHDDIAHKKVRLLLQHLVGYRSEGDRFSENVISKYDHVSFYDDDRKSIELAKGINKILKLIIKNTDDVLYKIIKEDVNINECNLSVNLVTHNGIMPFSTNEIVLKTNEIIKTFESFKNFYKKY